MQSLLGILLCTCLALGESEPPEDGEVLVRVIVTAVTGDDVYLDGGRLAKIEAGDIVDISTATGTSRALVRAISKSSSRAELASGGAVAVGDVGELRIPESRFAGSDDYETPEGELPPIEWESPNLPWDKGKPLLAPIAVRLPEARPSKLSGRIFTVIDQTWDNERNQEFLLLRQGLDAYLTNPFDNGGELHLDAEVFRRESELADETITDTRGRIDRASYSWGGTREEATRFEFGRFLQYEFSQLGVLDGVEVGKRTQSGSRYGMSLGLFPDPRSDFRTGDDLQAAAFYRSTPTSRDSLVDLEWGVALQNTWNRGNLDRQLIVSEVDYKPIKRLSFTLDSLIDHYGHNDVIKSSGFELTEFNFRTRLAFKKPMGVGAYYTYRRFPELLSEEFTTLTPDQILNNRVGRLGADIWRTFMKKFRISLSGGWWNDQDSNGSNGSLRFSAQDWLYDKGLVALDIFGSEGAFSRTEGARISANHSIAGSIIGVTYEHSSAKQDDFTGNQSELDSQNARINWDITLQKWSFSTYIEKRFGDQQDSFIAGLFMQYRF